MSRRYLKILLLVCAGCVAMATNAQIPGTRVELKDSWKFKRATDTKLTGETISRSDAPLIDWLPAIVPGTVLSSLLHNNMIPDPFYGMNNELIPDIQKTGRDYYTCWFVNDFKVPDIRGEQVYVSFRGVNYGYDIYLNGHKVNEQRLEGMFLRRRFNITGLISKKGNNRLAVIVYPPDPVGNPNGGQGGDGTIAHNLTNQYVAGWDWIQPIHDRNTGIWDMVFIEYTGKVAIQNTHIVTHVPGKRSLDGEQAPAIIKVTTEVENTDLQHAVKGKIACKINGKTYPVAVELGPGEKRLVALPGITIEHPRLWWPNGYGKPELYNMEVKFIGDDIGISGKENVSFGIRELKTLWNDHTQSRELYVNGQKVFIKGGNRILSDAMLRFSPERYDAEMRFHRDMNLNLIRVWGGGITERPEFYDACDRYGLLVMQDFWVSGDCNGRWYDPLKLEDTFARRKYPDDHKLFLAACADQIKMLRNHPSLAFWCGGNEIRPPADILQPLRDSVLPQLDGTRFFFEYSNDDSMSLNAHDGPYTIQADNYFWKNRSYGFNSEIGSVGIGDVESLERFIPAEHLKVPEYDAINKKWNVDSVWQYHKYYSYDSSVEQYGHPKDIADFAMKAQLVNYSQYRSLIESFIAKMWDWYTGVIIWKTQNPWTAMVGQMYDVYLDPNACLYGLAEGAKPTHVMYSPADHTLIIANTNPGVDSLRLEITGVDMNGKEQMAYSTVIPKDSVLPDKPYICHDFKGQLVNLAGNDGLFLYLRLSYTYKGKHDTDENLYWLPDRFNNYSGLSKMLRAGIIATADNNGAGSVTLQITNKAGNSIAFFNRVSLVDDKTKKRILPVFYNNNYISVFAGTTKTVTMSYTPQEGVVPEVCIEGWNVDKQYIKIKQHKK